MEQELEKRDRAESTVKWLRDNYEDIAQKVPQIEDMSYEETISKLSKGELKIFNDVEDIEEHEKMEKKLHLMQQQK